MGLLITISDLSSCLLILALVVGIGRQARGLGMYSFKACALAAVAFSVMVMAFPNAVGWWAPLTVSL